MCVCTVANEFSPSDPVRKRFVIRTLEKLRRLCCSELQTVALKPLAATHFEPPHDDRRGSTDVSRLINHSFGDDALGIEQVLDASSGSTNRFFQDVLRGLDVHTCLFRAMIIPFDKYKSTNEAGPSEDERESYETLRQVVVSAYATVALFAAHNASNQALIFEHIEASPCRWPRCPPSLISTTVSSDLNCYSLCSGTSL